MAYTFGTIKINKDSLHLLFTRENARTRHIQTQYDLHKKLVNPVEYIQETILKDKDYIITVNSYPYNVDCYHLLFWSKEILKGDNETKKQHIIKKAKEQGLDYLNLNEMIVWESNAKSIPEIEHYHLFIPYE